MDDQLKVEPLPLVTLVGFALIDTLGGVADTVTVADWLAVPPAPVQLKAYVALVESAPVVYVPLAASVPLHPPDAEHEVALVEDQVTVELPPLGTLAGLALIDIVGGLAGGALAASPLIVTIADVTEPRDAPEAPAMATAKVLPPVNGAALLMGIVKDLGDESRLPQLSEPCVAV